MSINMPIVKIAISQQAGVIPPVSNGGSNYNEHMSNPAFGFKPIENNGKCFNFFKMVDERFNSAWQRLVSGVTAIFTQPFFDWNNKHTDKDTRTTSTARTVAKIGVGTLTGVAIRELCIWGTKYFTQNENIYNDEKAKFLAKHKNDGKLFREMPDFKAKKLTQCLLPESAKLTATAKDIRRYRGAMGTFAALFVMLFTNFLVDAPLTMKLTNVLTPNFKKLREKQEAANKSEGGS